MPPPRDSWDGGVSRRAKHEYWDGGAGRRDQHDAGWYDGTPQQSTPAYSSSSSPRYEHSGPGAPWRNPDSPPRGTERHPGGASQMGAIKVTTESLRQMLNIPSQQPTSPPAQPPPPLPAPALSRPASHAAPPSSEPQLPAQLLQEATQRLQKAGLNPTSQRVRDMAVQIARSRGVSPASGPNASPPDADRALSPAPPVGGGWTPAPSTQPPVLPGPAVRVQVFTAAPAPPPLEDAAPAVEVAQQGRPPSPPPAAAPPRVSPRSLQSPAQAPRQAPSPQVAAAGAVAPEQQGQDAAGLPPHAQEQAPAPDAAKPRPKSAAAHAEYVFGALRKRGLQFPRDLMQPHVQKAVTDYCKNIAADDEEKGRAVAAEMLRLCGRVASPSTPPSGSPRSISESSSSQQQQRRSGGSTSDGSLSAAPATPTMVGTIAPAAPAPAPAGGAPPRGGASPPPVSSPAREVLRGAYQYFPPSALLDAAVPRAPAAPAADPRAPPSPQPRRRDGRYVPLAERGITAGFRLADLLALLPPDPPVVASPATLAPASSGAPPAMAPSPLVPPLHALPAADRAPARKLKGDTYLQSPARPCPTDVTPVVASA